MESDSSDIDDDTNDLLGLLSYEDYFFGEDIIDNVNPPPSEFDDCYLSPVELQEFQAPSVAKWKDCSVKDSDVEFSIDSCKKEIWKVAKKEITHVRDTLCLLTERDHESITNLDILELALGEKSGIFQIMTKELVIDHATFLRFMSTLCLQAAYRVTVSEMYCIQSALKNDTAMNEKDYLKIWKTIANCKKQEDDNYVGEDRRSQPLWEQMEIGLNNLCREVSISNRKGKVSVALDDDKIWLQQTGENARDKAGLNFTTHVRDNRKGLIAHTAVLTGTNLPLGMSVYNLNSDNEEEL